MIAGVDAFHVDRQHLAAGKVTPRFAVGVEVGPRALHLDVGRAGNEPRVELPGLAVGRPSDQLEIDAVALDVDAERRRRSGPPASADAPILFLQRLQLVAVGHLAVELGTPSPAPGWSRS
jgi:hypothetical protein